MNPSTPYDQTGGFLPVDDLVGRVMEQLQAMRVLRKNWDGYDADPPTPEALEFGGTLLEIVLRVAQAVSGRTDFPLYVAPGRDGGLFIQIELPPNELEIEIGPDLSISLLRTNTATGEQEERQFKQEERQLKPRPAEAAPELTAVITRFLSAA